MLFNNLLIIAAMEEEESALLSEVASFSHRRVRLSERFDLDFHEYTTPKRRISILRSGMGQVNAAVAVALFAEKYPLDVILLLGVGGALTTDLKIGELVVSRAVIQHDYYASLEFGNPRMQPGHIVFSPEDARAHSALFPADLDLLDLECEALRSVGVHIGTVLSGNEFVGTVERKKEIAELHGESLLVDMEAAGVAQMAKKLDITFLVAKTVADRLLPDGSIESDFRACLEAAARNSALVLRQLL